MSESTNQVYTSNYKGSQIDSAYEKVSQITSYEQNEIVTIDGNGNLISSGIRVDRIPTRPEGSGNTGDFIVYDARSKDTRVASGLNENSFMKAMQSGITGNIPMIQQVGTGRILVDTQFSMSELLSKIGALEARIPVLEARIPALEARIQNLEEFIDKGVCYIAGAETPAQED